MNYKHVIAANPKDLDEKVNEYISAGWSVNGPPYIANGSYHQCLVVSSNSSGITNNDAATLALLRRFIF